MLSCSFYRYTVTKRGIPSPVGHAKFDYDILLKGASVIACDSKEQRFYLIVSEMLISKEGKHKRIVGKAGSHGNYFFDWVGQVYFFVRVDTTKSILRAEQFMPNGEGFHIPKGKPVYLTLFSGVDEGVGGTIALYYIKDEKRK